MTVRDLRRRVATLVDRYIFRFTVVALVAAFFFVFFADRMIVQVPAGHSGVLWRRFTGGTVVSRTYGEGFHLIAPWNLMAIYDLRYRQIQNDITAVDRDGLALKIQLSTRYRLVPGQIGYLHKYIGPDYVGVLVNPEITAHTRQIVAEYTAEEVYSTKRKLVGDRVLELLRNEVSINRQDPTAFEVLAFVDVEDVLLRDIELPPLVATAIQEKIRQLHVAQEWEYRLQRERLESMRKEIEGDGIQKFQAKVVPGISEQYLRWKGIDATLKLAESPNSKVVIIGSGPQGLPVILGNEDVAGSPRTPVAPRPGTAPRAEAPTGRQPEVVAGPATPVAPGPAPGQAPALAAGVGVQAPSPPASPAPSSPPAATDVVAAGTPSTTAGPPPTPSTPAGWGLRGFFSRLLGLGS